MRTLKEEEPFAFAAQTEVLSKMCSFCFDCDKTVSKCSGCHMVSYCGKACQKNDWVNHKKECLLLKRSGTDPGPVVRLIVRILVKSESSLAQKSFNDRSWDSLDYLSLSASDEMSSAFLIMINYFMDFMKHLKNISREDVIKTFGKVVKHKRDIIGGRDGFGLGFGVYLGLSVHKTSCIPNAQLMFSGTKATLHCFDQTASYSTDLTICYTNLTPWDLNRKTTFKDKYFVDCTCPLCIDKNHIFNRMGSSCFVACCEDGVGVLDEDSPRGPFKCNKCGRVSKLTVNDVKRAETQIVFNMLKMEDPSYTINVKDVSRILHETGKVLSAYNFHVLHYLEKLINKSDSELESNEEFQKLAKQHCDMIWKAYGYYLHEMDVRMALLLLDRANMKLIFDYLDGFDVQAALDTAKRSLGEHHPVIVDFKGTVEAYKIRNELLREEQFRKAATNFNW